LTDEKDLHYSPEGLSKEKTTHYVMIRGPSYGSLEFEAREAIRTGIRERLEANGIRFVEYTWVWDEDDHCLLVVGRYEKKEDAFWWIKALESMGFEICIRARLPGDE
jgi:hypothetical protein